MSPQLSSEVQELKDVLDGYKEIADLKTRPSLREYAKVFDIELFFSIVAALILVLGFLNQDTMGELGLPTTLAGAGIVWVKSIKDAYDKTMSLADDRHNNGVFCRLLDIRINRVDSIKDAQERMNEINDLKEELGAWCKSLVPKGQQKACAYT